jgi:hypothetical protein
MSYIVIDSCNCKCAKDRLPLKSTECGTVSAANVTNLADLFLCLDHTTSGLAETYKSLSGVAAGTSKFVPTGHDSYFQYRTGENCWRFVPLPTRIYLDGLILKNFTEPLLKLGKNEFERGVKEGGNSSNLGLPIYTLVDGLISGISRLDCVMTFAGISQSAMRELAPLQQQEDATSAGRRVYNLRILQGLTKVVNQVHKSLIEMTTCSSSPLQLPKQCRFT